MVMRNLARAVTRDLSSLGAILFSAGRDDPPEGLHTYRYQSHGGYTRLHFRMQPDGTALLFRDVTDVLHLSPTAAHMCWHALEETPGAVALRSLQRRFRDVPRARLEADLKRAIEVVRTLADPRVACHGCQLELPREPLFSVRAQAPHKVDLALTYACNNRCSHCYNDPDRFDLESLDTQEWKRVIDVLLEVGVPQIIFTGGEATLHPGLPELVEYADRRGIIAGLNSNGRRLAKLEYAQTLARAGLSHVQVTLESHEPEIHDAMVAARAFEQTVAGIRTSLEAGLHVLTNSTITRLNADTIEETVAFLHELGLRTFAMNGMIYSGGGDANPDAIPQAELPAILMRVREAAATLGMRFLWYTVTEYCEMSPVELEVGAKRCNAGEYSMCVEPNADVLPCQSYYTSAGNLLRDPWEKIWKGALFRSFRDREQDPVFAGLPEKCHDCLDLPLCGGGCRIERESAQGIAPGGCQSCASGRTGAKAIRSSGGSARDALVKLRLAPRTGEVVA
jgi:radical SAM protein with 4Fe4S-binding SPASM domain